MERENIFLYSIQVSKGYTLQSVGSWFYAVGGVQYLIKAFFVDSMSSNSAGFSLLNVMMRVIVDDGMPTATITRFIQTLENR